MSDEVRAAAELCRKYPPGTGIDTTAEFERFAAARETVVAAYLAEHRPDDGEAIDEAWLREAGIPQRAKDDILADVPCHKLWTWPASNDPTVLLWFSGEERIPMSMWPKTRGDVRQLATRVQFQLTENPT